MQLQAITTKYLGPTNHRGSRIKATANGGSVTINYYDDQSSEQNHKRAVRILQCKLKWDYAFVSGILPNGDQVHIQLHKG